MHQLGIPQCISPRDEYTCADVQISRLTSYSLNRGCLDLVPGGHDPAGLDHLSACDLTLLGEKHFFLVEHESHLDCSAQRLGLDSALTKEYLLL